MDSTADTMELNVNYRFSYVWVIEDLNMEVEKAGKDDVVFLSPVFQTLWDDRYQVQIVCNEGMICTRLYLLSLDRAYGDRFGVRCSYSVVGKKNAYLHGRFEPVYNYCIDCNVSTGFKGVLLGMEKIAILFKVQQFRQLSNESITIEIIMDARDAFVPYAAYNNVCDSIKCNDRGALLLETGAASDLTIAVAGTELKAHKAILAIASPVFAAMFEHGFQEDKTNRLEIDDCDFHTLKQFLRYVYTEQIPEISTIQQAMKLYRISDKYDIRNLRAICKKYLIVQITSFAFTHDNIFTDFICS